MHRVRQITGPDGRPFIFPDENGIQPYIEAVLFGTDYPEPFPGEYSAETIIDIGAHIGSATRLFKHRYPTARVLAFEPNPTSFALLQQNLRGLSNVELVRTALSDTTGRAALFFGRYSSMQASLLPNEENTGENVKVHCINAADALASHSIRRISIIKLDAEGYEIPIMKALGNFLADTELIYLEYHSEADRLALDNMLKDDYVLFHAQVIEPHRGTIAFIANNLLSRLQLSSKRPRYAFPKVKNARQLILGTADMT
jgi:FkbM family methyltransferase